MKNIIIYTIPIPHDLIGFFHGSKPVRKREIQLRIILYSIEENTNSSSCSVRVASKGLVIFGRPRYALGRVQRVPMGRRGDLSDLVFTSLSLSPRERTSRSKILCRRTEGEGTWNQPTTSYFVGRDLDGVETASGGGRGGQRQRSGYVVEVVRCRVRDLPFFFFPR